MTAPIDNTDHVVVGPAIDRSGLVHRVRRPTTDGPHPTIVMLHGRHGDENAMWLLAPALPPGWLVVAPRAPVADPRGGFDWRPRKDDEWPALADFADAALALRRFVAALPALYGSAPSATYLMGFSQGAATAFAAAIEDRSIARGVASVVGFVPTDCGRLEDVQPLRGLPVFFAAGTRDPLIPIARSRQCADALRSIGAVVAMHEYDVGHKLSSQGMRDLRRWWDQRPESTGLERT